MTSTIPLNASSPFAGLGTAAYTVTTAGLYTLQFKSFLPYFPAGTGQTSQVVNEIQNITCLGDTSGSLNSTYWTFYDAGNAHGYYVWYNINSAGVDPAVAGLTGIQVAAATGANANTIASDTRTAIAAVSGIAVTITGGTSHVIINNTYAGSCTAAADGTAATSFTFSVTTAGSFGTPAASGLVVTLKQNSTVLATFANPTPTQAIMGGSAVAQASVSDVLSFVLSSQSTADALLNSVKSILNLFQGE